MTLKGLIRAVGIVSWGAMFTWAVERKTRIGPARSTSNVSISAPASGTRNCISELDVNSDAQFALNVLNGGTTIYSLIVSSGGSVIRSWDDNNALCGSVDAAMYINVSAGNMRINYQGFTY